MARRQVLFPPGGDIGADPHPVEHPERRDHRRPAGQQIHVFASDLAHELDPAAVGLLAAAVHVPPAGQGGGVEEVELQVVVPPIDGIADHSGDVVASSRMREVEGVEATAPVDAGTDRAPRHPARTIPGAL